MRAARLTGWHVARADATDEPRAFAGPAAPGTAVITGFTR